MNAKHTPGPWFVIPDYSWHGKHPLHDARHVATSQMIDVFDSEYGSDAPKQWRFQNERSKIVCTMPDAETQKADAILIASAPELLDTLKNLDLRCTQAGLAHDIGKTTMRKQIRFLLGEIERMQAIAVAAILKAEGK